VGEIRNAYKIFVEKLGRARCRRKDNITVDIKEI
jgi:hypothetical protein